MRPTHKDGRREVPARLPFFFVSPLFCRYSSSTGYSRHTQAYVGSTRVVRRRTGSVRGAYGVDSHDFFEGRFFVGFVEDFAVVEEQVKVFSFLDSDERKDFRKASCCLVSSGMLCKEFSFRKEVRSWSRSC